ncbi:hypothetical protein E2C01_086188 [Portunus trituberculatus]|uniref:Uncharacterized protein n=1 Tax=Portunus trituberculatus TaxID=210409 RepID=A0A5B7J8L8_PORTR|nr:hypothetical protein [Portunus trituberculatus]
MRRGGSAAGRWVGGMKRRMSGRRGDGGGDGGADGQGSLASEKGIGVNNETRDNAEGRDDSGVSGGASTHRQKADMTVYGQQQRR